MTPQEWLARWMEVKAEYAEYPAYFNEEDKQELLALSDELAMRIVLEMLEYDTDDMVSYIWSGKCPFCILTRGFPIRDFLGMKCVDCSYGLRHGICNRSDDDYSKFRRAFKECWHRHSGEYRDEEVLNSHIALADEVINQFVNSRLTPTVQLE